jgi:hypothetical protein
LRTQAIQFAQLQELLTTMYADKPRVPVLIGPDTNGFGDAIKFLGQAQDLGVTMHAITYHEYTTSVQNARQESLAKMRHASVNHSANTSEQVKVRSASSQRPVTD